MLNEYLPEHKLLIFIDLKIILKAILFFISFLMFLSCKKEQKKGVVIDSKTTELSVAKKYDPIEKIKPNFTKETENWEELNALQVFLERFKNTTPNEVLSNALELKELVQNLKDSIKPSLFNSPSFNSRVNILNNEVLRLADMTFIPAIKADEVSIQTDKTLKAFSAINAKINAILSKKRFEEAIDIDINYIGLDTTKIDSVSKKTIDKKLEEKLRSKQIKNKTIKPRKLKEIPNFKKRNND